MKINITNAQYRTLLKVFYLGEWMMNSNLVDEEGETEGLEQYIYSLAETFGCSDWIQKDKESGEYFPSQELEAEVNDFMDDYDEQIFWEQLSTRLARRDFLRKVGVAEFAEAEVEKLVTEIEDIAEKYREEFAEDGLENLGVLKRFS